MQSPVEYVPSAFNLFPGAHFPNSTVAAQINYGNFSAISPMNNQNASLLPIASMQSTLEIKGNNFISGPLISAPSPFPIVPISIKENKENPAGQQKNFSEKPPIPESYVKNDANLK